MRTTKKVIRSNQQKKRLWPCSTQYLYILNDYNLKPNSDMFYGGNFVCAHEKCCCSCSSSLLLIFTLLSASISRCLTGATKFHVVLPKNFRFFVFHLSLSLQLFLEGPQQGFSNPAFPPMFSSYSRFPACFYIRIPIPP